MNKNYYFLCPLPRSGQTLINMVLNKSEQIRVSANSIIPDIFDRLQHLQKDSNIYKNFPYEKGFNNIYKNIFDNYYSSVQQKHIIDNGTWGTPGNLNILKNIFKERKFIIYNRPVLECLASFIKIEKPKNVEARCDELMHQNGRLYKSLWSIHNLKKTENFVEFQFNDIINNMDEVIKRIFTFLNLEPEKLSKEVTKFNFDGTVYDDSVLYGPLHNLQPDPDPHNYKDFLTSAVIEKYKHFDGL